MEQTKSFFTIRELCYTALAAALLVICSWIAIPLPTGISVTLQTFAVFFITGLLGLKCGVISVIVFLLLGAVGIPVFTGFQGGIGQIMSVTGGYKIGFIFSAIAVGLIIKFRGKSVPVLIISMIIGLILCYLFGSIWFQVLYVQSGKGSMSFITIISLCVIPYLIPDAVKITLAVFLVRRLDGKIKL